MLRELSLGRIIGCWGGSLVYRATFRQQHVVVMVRRQSKSRILCC